MTVPKNDHADRSNLEEKISRIEKRKIEARKLEHQTIWFGLGTFGLVGWSVTVPTLLGIAIGIWIDSRFPSRFSWTLMLLVLGVALGCLNAWRWVCREGHEAPGGEESKQE
ncbi:MAG: AtpZ/AtpI family protein [Planctomycetales bacterium]|nr:AtpZ/AtpI family protein [Planctomycetales bacterium]